MAEEKQTVVIPRVFDDNRIQWATEIEAAIWRPWDFADLPKSPNCCDYNPLVLRNEDIADIVYFEKIHNLGYI